MISVFIESPPFSFLYVSSPTMPPPHFPHRVLMRKKMRIVIDSGPLYGKVSLMGINNKSQLTKKQSQILKIIVDFEQKYRSMPTFQEIADAAGLAGPSSVQRHIQALVDLGYLIRDSIKERSIKVSSQLRNNLDMIISLGYGTLQGIKMKIDKQKPPG